MGSLELVGVIGTWAAVALALIALIGILPIYIGYRRKASTWANQVGKVDDPNQDFVSRGWLGIPGERLFRRVHVPNLLNPPDIRGTVVRRTSCPRLWPRNSQSRTGWVNFLNILRSYDVLDPNPHPDGRLEMVGGELMLPIHRSWILLLGLVDRYSRRQDYGLLSGESREPQVRLRFNSGALSGLSGVMSLVISDQDEEQGSEQDIICFHMHRLSQIGRLSSEASAGDSSLKTLLFLFLGYIPGMNGHLYFAELPSKTDYHFTDRNEEREMWELREVERNSLYQDHGEIFEELGTNPTKVYILHSRQPSEEEEKLFSGPAGEYYDLSPRTIDPALIRRTHANAVLKAAMDLGCNRQSFLYGRGKGKDKPALMFSILGRKGLKTSIKRALDALDGDDQRNLQGAMEETLNTLSEYGQPASWSRSLWAELSTLHKAIVDSFSEEEHPSMLAIGVLFSLDHGFRKLLTSFDTKPAHERKRNSLTLDFPAKAIKFPAPDGTGNQSFFFDFAEFFRDLHGNPSANYLSREPENIPYADFAIGCLRSHIIMAIWSMCIPSNHLSNLYSSLEPTIYVSARTLPRRKRSTWDSHSSPDSLRTGDYESDDWWEEDSSGEERVLLEDRSRMSSESSAEVSSGIPSPRQHSGRRNLRDGQHDISRSSLSRTPPESLSSNVDEDNVLGDESSLEEV